MQIKTKRSHKETALSQSYLVKKKSSHGQNKCYQFNHQYFQFDIPQPKTPSGFTSPSKKNASFSEKPLNTHFEDCRKEILKQKIKFRVKQEMWNILKKNYQKILILEPPVIEEKIIKVPQKRQITYIKGSSFTKVTRQNFYSRKYSQIEKSRTDFKQILGDSSKNDQVIPKKHRRIWSSAVKMKQKDRLQMEKTQNRASSSAIYLEKMDLCKIQPWKGFQDPQMCLQ